MLRSILGFDWQKSNAHWLLLNKFVRPRKPDDFANDIWEDVLGELPKHAIERFAAEGLEPIRIILRHGRLSVHRRNAERQCNSVPSFPSGLECVENGSSNYEFAQLPNAVHAFPPPL